MGVSNHLKNLKYIYIQFGRETKYGVVRDRVTRDLGAKVLGPWPGADGPGGRSPMGPGPMAGGRLEVPLDLDTSSL